MKQDNEPFSFITLSAATERAISQLPKLEKQKESTRQKQDGEHDHDQERRVRDILEMENRLRRKMN
jgi:hypothetical protein